MRVDFAPHPVEQWPKILRKNLAARSVRRTKLIDVRWDVVDADRACRFATRIVGNGATAEDMVQEASLRVLDREIRLPGTSGRRLSRFSQMVPNGDLEYCARGKILQ